MSGRYDKITKSYNVELCDYRMLFLMSLSWKLKDDAIEHDKGETETVQDIAPTVSRIVISVTLKVLGK